MLRCPVVENTGPYAGQQCRREAGHGGYCRLTGKISKAVTSQSPNVCPDCGERGARKGHQDCRYPQD